MSLKSSASPVCLPLAIVTFAPSRFASSGSVTVMPVSIAVGASFSV